MELLSPVGDFECLKAAIQNGANSVYLGTNMFNARTNARNFDLDSLEKAIIYAKLRNVKTYLTLNILIKNDELNDSIFLAKKAYEYGIDAIIVQDIGLAIFLIENFPDLPIHASTQMTTHNLKGVLQLKNLGFKRVVLSRELNIDDIKYICNNSEIEIETFIHGALCMSYSGQCLFSSMIGARSGNRGTCAQACRLPYSLIEKNNTPNKNTEAKNIIDKGYLLSPRDLCGLEHIPDLIESGVTSLKIEGRMKSPEYVAIVTKIYRKYIDLALSNNEYIIDNNDKKELLQAFNRGGFSTGHIQNKPNRDFIFKEKPNNTGIYLGNISSYNPNKGYIKLKLNEKLAIGDTVSVNNQSGKYTISEIMEKNNNIKCGNINDNVIIGRIKGNINVGDKIYKLSSKELSTFTKNTYSNIENIKTPFKCTITVKKNMPISINIKFQKKNSIIYNDINFDIFSDIVPITAINKPITSDRIISQFSKTTDTPFVFNDINVILDDNVFIPTISSLNELRRKAISQIEELAMKNIKRYSNLDLEEIHNSFENNTELKIEPITKENKKKKISILLNNLNIDYNYSDMKNVEKIYIPIMFFINKKYEKVLKTISSKFNMYIYMPTIIKDPYKNLMEDQISKAINSYNIKGIILSNISQIYLIDIINKVFPNKSFDFICNYTFNVFNNKSMELLYKSNFSTITLSPESDEFLLLDIMLNNSLTNKDTINNKSNINSNMHKTELIVYGKTLLMTTNYCFIGNTNKCYPTCNSDCQTTSSYYLRDRLNLDFRIAQDNLQTLSYIYNSKTTSINSNNFSNDYSRIDILDENIDEINTIIECIEQEKKLEGSQFTNGNLKRKI